MIDALSMSEIGMINDVQRMQVISNNIANASTVGFKKEVPVARPFAEALDLAAGAGRAAASGAMRPVLTSSIDFAAGSLKFTGNPLDLAVEGDGFFVLETAGGEALTRQGSFRLDEAGRIVSVRGEPLIGVGGELHLTRPDARIDQHGRIWEGQTEVGQLRIVGVKNPDSLVRLGAGIYVATESTEQVASETARVRQGYSEAGNVEVLGEMVKMIETVRHFEASQRIIRGYDQMLDRAINVLGESN